MDENKKLIGLLIMTHRKLESHLNLGDDFRLGDAELERTQREASGLLIKAAETVEELTRCEPQF